MDMPEINTLGTDMPGSDTQSALQEQVPAGEQSPDSAGSILAGTEGETAENSSILTAADEGQPEGGDSEDSQENANVPETYDFKVSEEYALTPEIMDAVTPVLKKHNLSQEAAQELADVHMELLRKQNEAMYAAQAKMIKEWQEAAKADPDFGGANYEKNVGLARKAFKYMTPKDTGEAKMFHDILVDSGMGNNPVILKAFARIGKLISEDSVLGNGEMGGRSKGFDPETDMFAVSLGLRDRL